MSFEGLQERLTALQETTTQLQELIDRLANLKFEPGSVPLDADEESSVSGELGTEISQMLRDGMEEQELLLEEIKYLRPESHEKSKLEEGAQRLAKELISSRFSFRKARLSAAKKLKDAQKLERELLIQSYSMPVSETASAHGSDEAPEPHQRIRQIHHQHQQYSSLSEEDQQTVGASSNVTNALRRTHDLIAAELSRSEFAHQTLTESSAALKQLDESYSSLDTMLASSKDLLGTLLRSQKSDTWYLQTALYMLLATGAWLFFRRLLYGPLLLLVWWPLRVMFGLGSIAGGAVTQGKTNPSESQFVEVHGGVPVRGLPKEDLPTAQVKPPAGGSDSEGTSAEVMDTVKKVVDSVKEAEELGSIPEEPEANPEPVPNDRNEASDTRQRDEL
ncbi:hypothetical protein HJFPF1_00880 [Paramyrothecium foliicola]|nr:hypothetical protein HJFPF1_00880 [Paramyrothecium foliicola]